MYMVPKLDIAVYWTWGHPEVTFAEGEEGGVKRVPKFADGLRGVLCRQKRDKRHKNLEILLRSYMNYLPLGRHKEST